MPSVFSRIDAAQKRFFNGQPTTKLSLHLPPGTVVPGTWVTSAALAVPGHCSKVVIRGVTDTHLVFSDGTFGITDFKTTTPKPEHVEFYGRQLHAYALALENPGPGKAGLAPITRLGLACFAPTDLVELDELFGLRMRATWVEIPRDDEAFFAFLGEVIEVLESPSPPASNDCPWCAYRAS
jgi:hypothetical protein